MIARHLQGLTAALVSAADEVDRPQPVVERAAAALLLERNPQREAPNPRRGQGIRT
jgi:hypothetical protein